jgi:hypothetical protein
MEEARRPYVQNKMIAVEPGVINQKKPSCN